MTATRTERIRALNDALRCANKQGTMLMTPGVRSLTPALLQQVLAALANYDAFTAEDDPSGEHDFGAFRVGRERLFFRIDCYDPSGCHRSLDPANPAMTRRVLTLMLAEES